MDECPIFPFPYLCSNCITTSVNTLTLVIASVCFLSYHIIALYVKNELYLPALTTYCQHQKDLIVLDLFHSEITLALRGYGIWIKNMLGTSKLYTYIIINLNNLYNKKSNYLVWTLTLPIYVTLISKH